MRNSARAGAADHDVQELLADASGRSARARNRLPPLNLLRTFEAAAWHGSFTAAASELCVTQSAVSQQIRGLELFLGKRLFTRLAHSMKPTPEGEIFADAVREALAIVGRASAKLQEPASSRLNVSVSPSFGRWWLVAKLGAFRQAHPDILVTLVSSNDQLDFEHQDIDVAIRWGNGRWSNANLEYLGDQVIVPVCSPAYLGAASYDHDKRLFRACTLLNLTANNYWDTFFQQCDVPVPDRVDKVLFSDTALMLEACAQGQGVGLATKLLVEDELATGRLVRPYDGELDVGHGFYALWGKRLRQKPAAHAFIEWLTTEISAVPKT